MIDSYITVAGFSREEIIISKSRFIGYISPCEDESSALAFLQRIREEHKTATHHCYAYIIGINSGIMRYSDDGEPGGTAGMPILDVLRSKHAVNCCIVIVRYFGGVLLGTGGLVRAYTKTAQAALEAAGLASMERTSVSECDIPYSVWDKVRYTAGHLPVRIDNVRFGSSVSFQLYFRNGDGDAVLPQITEASDRKIRITPLDDCYIPWKIET